MRTADAPLSRASRRDRHSLGANLRAERVRRGLRIEDVAAAAAMNPNHVSRIERDLASPRIEQLQRICRAIGCAIDEVFVLPAAETAA